MSSFPSETKQIQFEPFVDEKTVAAILGVSAKFLEEDRTTHRHGIPHYKIGSRVKYRLSEVMAWAERQAVYGTEFQK